MNLDIQRKKAAQFLALHSGPDLLLMPNVWNPIGARILEARGYPAIATASAAISASLGYRDGERIRRATLIDIVGRIAGSVAVPVTADIEAGYAVSLSELAETIEQVIDAGVVGINIEDSLDDQHRLRPVAGQCERLAQVRRTAEQKGLPLVINARIDSFMSIEFNDNREKISDAVSRAAAYFNAGADCVYPIGPGDRSTVSELRNRIEGPINILAAEHAESIRSLTELGVNRVTFGPFVFRSCLKKFIDIADSLRAAGDYGSFADNTIPASQLREYLLDGMEPES